MTRSEPAGTPDKDLILPDSLRDELKKPFGRIVECSDIPKIINKRSRLIAVGDSVSSSLINQGLFPALIIWDGRTMRKPVGEATLRVLRKYAPIRRVRNPAGMISKQAWKAIADGMTKKRASVWVEGEEDLLAIPAVINAKEGAKVIYGYPPEQGAILIDVDRKIKASLRELVSKFEKSKK